jgi:hypothetical protein
VICMITKNIHKGVFTFATFSAKPHTKLLDISGSTAAMPLSITTLRQHKGDF